MNQVFSLFKDYLENQLETKTKEIEKKTKIDKEVVQLKFRGNQKQFELNAALILSWRPLMLKVNEARQIKIASKSSPRTLGRGRS